MAGHVFVSYSRTDLPYVAELSTHLRSAGIPVWYDRDLTVGDRLAAVIQKQISNCAAVIVVLTPDSVESEWVDRELSYALRKCKPVLPLVLRSCDDHLLLANIHHEDVTGSLMPSPRLLDYVADLIAGIDRND